MRKGSETAKIYEAYKSLFSLPSKEKIAIINLLELALLCIILWIIDIENFYAYLLLTIYYLIYILIIKLTVLFKETTLDLRRSLGLSAITNGVGFLCFLLGLTIKHVSYEAFKFLSLLSAGFITIITGLVLYTNSAISFPRSLFSSLTIASLIAFILNYISGYVIFNDIITFLAGLMIYVLTMISIIFIPTRLASVIGNIDGIELTRGFIFAWVMKSYRKLERVLKRISIKRRVPMGFIRVRKLNSGEELYIIISNIHPGPFLNVGSANLPYMVSNWFKKNANCDAILLHGTCSHSENLPSRDEVERVIAKFNEIRLRIPLEEYRGTIIRKKFGDLTFLWNIINQKVFLAITKSPKPMDDLYIGVGILFRELLRSRGLDGLIIDNHNSLKEPSATPLIGLEDRETRDIISETRNFLANYDKIEFKTKIAIGWGNVKCEALNIDDGLGPGGVWAIYHNYGNENFVAVIIDSNNLGTGVREEIIRELSKLGYNVEVFTTDTHVVNAVKPGAGGYKLLQISNLDKLIPCIKNAVKTAKTSAERVEIGVLVDEIDALMIGEENVNKLLLVSIVGNKAFKFSLIVTSIMSIIAFILLSII